ncbi:hypothetical protein ACWDBW_26090 [Streptomyces sp. NPDC001107]
MSEQEERGWDGPSTVSVADWVAAQPAKAPEPGEEQRGALTIAANMLELAWRNRHEEPGVVPDMRVSYRAKDPV